MIVKSLRIKNKKENEDELNEKKDGYKKKEWNYDKQRSNIWNVPKWKEKTIDLYQKIEEMRWTKLKSYTKKKKKREIEIQSNIRGLVYLEHIASHSSHS